MILRNSRQRKTNLHVAGIDYKKLFDLLPHSSIAKCLEIVGVSGYGFMEGSTNGQWASTWLRPRQKRDLPRSFIEPTALRNSHDSHDNNTQADRIRIPNFKSAAKISHLLYIDDLKLYGKSSNELESLLNTVRIFSTDVSMEFGLEKCATLTIHKGKATHTEGLTLSPS